MSAPMNVLQGAVVVFFIVLIYFEVRKIRKLLEAP